MICLNCGHEVAMGRKQLIAQLAKLTGVKEHTLQNLTINAATALIVAWKKRKGT